MNYKFVKGSVALAVLAALSGCNISSNDSVAPCTENVCKLTILHTNDTHGRFWHNDKGEYGMAAQKTLVERLRGEAKAAGSEVLVLSGGDVNTGVPESDLQDAAPDFKGMNLLGYQAMAVGLAGAESSLENALTELREFGIQRARAVELIQQVARVVHGWQVHFVQQGVCRADMELLQASIDRDALRMQRVAFL